MKGVGASLWSVVLIAVYYYCRPRADKYFCFLLSFEDCIILVQLFSNLPLVCLKIFNVFFVPFLLFFAEIEDALAKLIFLMANKCLS